MRMLAYVNLWDVNFGFQLFGSDCLILKIYKGFFFVLVFSFWRISVSSNFTRLFYMCLMYNMFDSI